MSIFNHNIFENTRTRVIVLHQGRVLMIPPDASAPEGAWTLPGGGLNPHESLAECARRETLEETGIPVRVGRIAFLREWIVPRHTQSTAPDADGRGHGYGLEVFYYAAPEDPVPAPRPEQPDAPLAIWVPLTELTLLPLWPKELRVLGQRLLGAQAPEGCVSIVAELESPSAKPEHDPFA
jgi:ADP-ribose pyrophosphatase YjhB (NUDIX family)